MNTVEWRHAPSSLSKTKIKPQLYNHYFEGQKQSIGDPNDFSFITSTYLQVYTKIF